MLEHVDTKDRTFETRLKFLNSIFSDIYEQQKVLTSGIEFKLKELYNNYVKELDESVKVLETKNPVTVLKKINKEI